MTNLVTITKELSNYLDTLKRMFEQNEKPKADKDFFQFVKGETVPYFDLLEKWEQLALLAIQKQKSILQPQQITSTKENMEALILHSYYVDIRKRQYMEINKSCHYIFNQLIKEFEE